LALTGTASAQDPPAAPAGQPPSASTAGTAPVYDPDQLPAQRGKVQQFTLTPRGDIDGLILADGTEVVLPPHLSTEVAYSVKPGDTVVVHGLHAAALPLIKAVSVTDEASGRTVTDNGPPPPGAGPAPPPPLPSAPDAGPSAPLPGLTEVRGQVRMALYGPRGDVNGALLDDGTILRLPPPEAERFADLLQPGRALVAEGSVLVSAIGKVVAVRQLGPSRTRLSLVATPPGPGRRPPPGPGAGPPPPPRP
jgi:hypothetical protein